jgi:hypothetical protein
MICLLQEIRALANSYNAKFVITDKVSHQLWFNPFCFPPFSPFVLGLHPACILKPLFGSSFRSSSRCAGHGAGCSATPRVCPRMCGPQSAATPCHVCSYFEPFLLSFVLLAGAKLPGLLGLQSIKSEPILSIKKPTSNQFRRYIPHRLFALQVELYQVPV